MGLVTINGVVYQIMPSTVFGFPIVLGQSFCFLFNSNTFITGCLLNIPTAITGMESVRRGTEVFD
jgi:hypothetical protein